MDACKRHRDCFKEGSEHFSFLLGSSEEALEGPQSRQRSVCLQRGGRAGQTSNAREARGREMNSRVNVATEKPGKIPQQRVTSQRRTRRISCKPESRQKRDYPEPMKQTVPITRGDGIPPTALKGSCMGKHHATAHSPSQSTASTRRKGDSKRDSLKGFRQPPGAQQPTSVVPLQAFLNFFLIN